MRTFYFSWKAHSEHFQMRYNRPYYCKCLPRYNINELAEELKAKISEVDVLLEQMRSQVSVDKTK